MQAQRGFSLVETLVVVSLSAALIVFVVATQGDRPPQVHVAALNFEAALLEARALAMSDAGVGYSGAMLTVEPSGTGTVVSIFESRPLEGWPPPTPDAAFPPLHLPVPIALGAESASPRPFAVLISSSGYASIQSDYSYDPAHPIKLSTDPGCDETEAPTVTVSDGLRKETHPIDCRETRFDMTASS